MVFSRGPVVGLSGLAFVTKIAQMFPLAVADDSRPPEPLIPGEPDAFITGPAAAFLRVPGVLSDSRQTQISPAVIETGAVNMVDDVPLRRPD